MSKKFKISYLILFVLSIAGIVIRHFIGGFMTGASVTVLLFITVGRWFLMEAVKKVDENIVNRKTNL